VERIASGGMGEVFRAHDAVLAREVAIKVLHRSLAGDGGFIDRFRREARAAASLNHPNIVHVHDWGAVDGVYFMVMEYVRGESLREILNENGLLAPAQAADVLLQVLAALEHAHRQGIVHRDVKPENVIVTREGVAKVADFGLARAYADSRATQAGTVSGTVQYLAPEQLQGEPADPRTDLYSLGIVAFELLTGRTPFNAETSMAIAYKHIRDRVPPPSSKVPAVPPGLDGWVASMTERARELRPESAEEARRDLINEVATLPSSQPLASIVRSAPDAGVEPAGEAATTVTIPGAPTRRKHRRSRRAFGVLAVLLTLAAAAWGAWTYLLPHSVEVPQVVGLSISDAQARLTDDGLTVRMGGGVYSMRVPKDAVVRMRPQAGATLKKGTQVTLIPSLGPPPVPVPDLTNMSLAEAKAALAKAHLTLAATITREYSDTIPVDHVITQSVPATDEAPRGSEIAVTLSKGQAPIPVPKVVGMSEEKAASLLSTAGFVVKRSTDYSDTVPRGDVIGQAPAPKSKLQPGQAVTIVVSLGPKTFQIQSFLGMSETEAVAAIRALGLVPAVLPVPGATGHTVVSQLPGAGSTVKAGQTITIYVA
jgi:eukaryotic-like serine/threonine-protein kinase